MTTQIQVTYKQKPNDPNQEIELLRFQSKPAALKFLESITKNPDVACAKLL